MTIQKTLEGSTLTLAPAGRLDTITAHEFEEEANQSIGNVTELILDFEQLDYISSAGLRVLLSLQKKMSTSGSMKVIHVNDIVSEVFSITGFDSVLTIE